MLNNSAALKDGVQLRPRQKLVVSSSSGLLKDTVVPLCRKASYSNLAKE